MFTAIKTCFLKQFCVRLVEASCSTLCLLGDAHFFHRWGRCLIFYNQDDLSSIYAVCNTYIVVLSLIDILFSLNFAPAKIDCILLYVIP